MSTPFVCTKLYTVPSLRVAFLGLLVLFAVMGPSGCEAPEKIVTPSLGAIEVTTVTEGLSLAPDGFEVYLNGGRSGSVSPNGTYLIPSLPDGDYQVGLLEESADCRYVSNPRKVSVAPLSTTSITFLVICK